MFGRALVSPSRRAGSVVESSSQSSPPSMPVTSISKKPGDNIKEERLIKKARKTLDGYLNKVGEIAGRPGGLSLNLENGTCSFPYQRFLVVLELPRDQPDTVCLYTCVCRLEDSLDNVEQVMQTAMEMNYMQHQTRGASLGVRQSEINLFRSFALGALDPAKLRNILEEFLSAAIETNAKLERSKRAFHTSTTDHMVTRQSQPHGRPSRMTNQNRARTFTK